MYSLMIRRSQSVTRVIRSLITTIGHRHYSASLDRAKTSTTTRGRVLENPWDGALLADVRLSVGKAASSGIHDLCVACF